MFDLPLDPPTAAQRILEIRDSLDVAAHSRRTSEEIREKFDPDAITRFRYEQIAARL